MDWANESYVRLYVRDTKTWMLLGWEGQCLLPLILRKLDRSGVLADVFNAEDLSVMLANGMPVDVIERGLSRLAAKEVVTFCDVGLLMANYLVAQETPKTDKQRQKESRERRSVSSRIVTGESRRVTIESQDRSDLSQVVTDGHAPSQVVTPCLALPDSAVPCLAEQGIDILSPLAKAPAKKTVKVPPPKSAMHSGWVPSDERIEAICTKLSVSKQELLRHVPEFRLYWMPGGKGCVGPKAQKRPHGWDQAFSFRVDQLVEWGRIQVGTPGSAVTEAPSRSAQSLGLPGF